MLTFSVEEEMDDADYDEDEDFDADLAAELAAELADGGDDTPQLVTEPAKRKKKKPVDQGESGEVIALDAFRKK
jgi:hypothetical protein